MFKNWISHFEGIISLSSKSYFNLILMWCTSLGGWIPMWHGEIIHEVHMEGLATFLRGLLRI
jgi:hypothetical protein